MILVGEGATRVQDPAIVLHALLACASRARADRTVRLKAEIRMGTRNIMSARCFLRAVPWVLSVCVLLSAGSATASSQGIAGTLTLQRTSGFVLQSRDATIHAPASPMCPAADSSITLDDGVHTHTFLLPCANWTDRGTVAVYRNSSAPGGPSEVRMARNKAGILNVIGRGLGGFPIPTGTATINVLFDLGGANERYCMSFSGVGDGKKFRVRNAPAGTCPVCGNDTVDPGETCDRSADAACPNNCLADCTCAAACPMTEGNATACQAFGTLPQCASCCSEDEECLICVGAYSQGCAEPSANDACGFTINFFGCASQCCL